MKARSLTKETILNIGMTDRKFPAFKIGDNIEISQTIKDGDKERTQLFAGDVIAINNNGIASTITVRRMGANGIGVEKIFPYYSPGISAIRLVKNGIARRAKLYYLRDREGKAARIKERVLTKEQKDAQALAKAQAA
jgi:large subunit ribosomal protein L19